MGSPRLPYFPGLAAARRSPLHGYRPLPSIQTINAWVLMNGFQLDPHSIAERARPAGSTAPSLGASLALGIVGFTVVSLAGFVPWAFFGRWFYEPGHGGEAGMYIACALVFILLSGPVLHRLIIGPGSLVRFYQLFTPAFALYSVGWIVGWMSLGGYTGSVVGLLSGTTLMGALLTLAFGVRSQALTVIAVLFVLNCAGYFVGGWAADWVFHLEAEDTTGSPETRLQLRRVAMMSWGVFYGLGFGAGLGLAFYLCQSRARYLLDRS